MMDSHWPLYLFLVVFFAQTLVFTALELLNQRRQLRPPRNLPEFNGLLDEERLTRIREYGAAGSKFRLVKKLPTDALFAVCLCAGPLKVLRDFASTMSDNFVCAGLIFFACITLAVFLWELPFSYYRAFVIEEKFGFNRSSPRLWITDHLKSLLVSAVLMSIILGPLLWIIAVAPYTWWIWGFLVTVGVQLALTVLYPLVIAPLFNRFDPLEDTDLARRIEALAARAGMKAGGVFQMDAGRRTAHSNAYFTGLGKTKRIVLFDTLLEAHTHDEILSVLAHELGHFKLRHILKLFVGAAAATLLSFWAAAAFTGSDAVRNAFAFSTPDLYMGLVIAAVFLNRIGFFLTPISAAVSRRFEREADDYAGRLMGTTASLASAIRKLTLENLGDPDPHPLYAGFYYSHPAPRERIARLEHGG